MKSSITCKGHERSLRKKGKSPLFSSAGVEEEVEGVAVGEGVAGVIETLGDRNKEKGNQLR